MDTAKDDIDYRLADRADTIAELARQEGYHGTAARKRETARRLRARAAGTPDGCPCLCDR
jgi:hypothetical protein